LGVEASMVGVYGFALVGLVTNVVDLLIFFDLLLLVSAKVVTVVLKDSHVIQRNIFLVPHLPLPLNRPPLSILLQRALFSPL